MYSSLRRIFLIFGLSLLLIFGSSSAQGADADSSRISRLEAEIFSLRSQINQLQSEVARLGRLPPSSPVISPPQPQDLPPLTPTPRQPEDPSLVQQFDNLAILAIELKERIQTVEERLAEIEVRFSP